MNILLAADGSIHTKRMLAYIAAHEDVLGVRHRYTVVHATTRLPGVAAAFVEGQELKAIYRSEAEKVFKPIRAFFKQRGIEARFVGLVGPVAESIAREAERAACDLLVMGSHGRDGRGSLANLVMGSVATRMLAQSKVPVLLVR